MSASRVSACPRCMARARKAREDRLALVQGFYGKIPEAEYRAALDDVPPIPSPDMHATFAEYWDIHGASAGRIQVDYGAQCSACGLEVTFNHAHVIPGITGEQETTTP